jgi:hypothetical protein
MSDRLASSTQPEARACHRAAALTRLGAQARADGLSPPRIAELEGALTGAFAINDLMALLFGERDG